MAQYFLDLVYTLTNCMSCFPGSPQLKINNRSFKILRLLGEVYKQKNPSSKAQADRLTLGRILICLSRPRYRQWSSLCSQEDPLSIRTRIRCAGHEGSRGLCALCTKSEYYPQRRLLRFFRSIWSGRKDCIHSVAILQKGKSARYYQCESGQSYQIPWKEIDDFIPGGMQSIKGNALL